MGDTPRYEELKRRSASGRGSPPSDTALRVMAMEPGMVLDFGEATAANRKRLSGNIHGNSGHVRTRSKYKYGIRARDGRLYVICFKPEDIKGGAD